MTEFIQISGDRPAPIFDAIARIHAQELSAGLLPLLGKRFLRQLYRRAALDRQGLLIVAKRNGQCVGFVMGTTDPPSYYRGVRLRALPAVGLALVRNPRLVGRILSLARYASRQPGAPFAELLSIAVAASQQRFGVGQGLYDAFCRELSQRGIEEFCVTASETQGAALKFYRRQGGEVVSETDLGGLRSFTFICRVPDKPHILKSHGSPQDPSLRSGF